MKTTGNVARLQTSFCFNGTREDGGNLGTFRLLLSFLKFNLNIIQGQKFGRSFLNITG